MTANNIWEMVVERLSAQLTHVTMVTWINPCEPLDLDGDCFVIRVKDEFRKSIILSRFAPAITEALRDIFSTPRFDLIVLTEEEKFSAEGKDQDGERMPEVPGYTFADFVVGPSNTFAHAAALGVSKMPGGKYNPLFLYGNSGLGKTHLLLAIGYTVRDLFPQKQIVYVKGEAFINNLVKSIKDGKMEEFRTKYRRADLLLVDDIQFIAGKERTQDEFFHTFNELYEAGKQIVITSDRPPVEMTLLDDRLRTRFEGGLMADIQPPDLETRNAIARNKAVNAGLSLTDEQFNYIASRIKSNVRQLEGVIKKLAAYTEILERPVAKEEIDRTIEEVIRTTDAAPSAGVIIRETAKYCSLTPEQLRGDNRSRNIALARQIAMYLMRKLTPMSFPDIGSALKRNHTTAISSVSRIDGLLKTDPDLPGMLRDIESNIKNTTDISR